MLIRSAALVFGVTSAVATIALWLYPLGLGAISPLWTAVGFAAILGAGLVAPRRAA
jgi:hypothetical protein